jgi:hypothetical protein
MQAKSLYHRVKLRNHTRAFLALAQRPNPHLDPLILEVSRSHTIRQTNPVTLLWTSDQLDPQTATYTTHNKNKRRISMSQCDSNPRSRRSNGFRLTRWNAWLSESATWTTRRRVFWTSALEYSKWHNSLSDDRFVPLCQGLSGTTVWTTLKKNVAAKKQKLSQESWLLWPQDGESEFVRNIAMLAANDTASHKLAIFTVTAVTLSSLVLFIDGVFWKFIAGAQSPFHVEHGFQNMHIKCIKTV